MERKTNSLDKHMAKVFLHSISMPSIHWVECGPAVFHYRLAVEAALGVPLDWPLWFHWVLLCKP